MSDIAVVVGATGALGRAIVHRLRRHELTVLAIARSRSHLEEVSGGDPRIVGVVADVGDDASIATIADAIGEDNVRIVVHAVGLPGSGSTETITPAEITSGVEVKIGGLVRVLQAVDDRLPDGSRIVVLGGHYGYEPTPAAPLAGMINAALGNFVRSLSDSWGPRGVTVHLVAPGPVDSPRMRAIAERSASRKGISAEQVLDEYRAASPLGRLTTIDEVAWAVTLLLEPEAAALHGSTLSLDLGRRRGIG